ncbi:DNA internalization-related competence protein ComEC/Rec2 [bacterium]|nr:DNA internalization-related competence protein ComEC/Rec2 [candidate division CSSED10-310 bacterium]
MTIPGFRCRPMLIAGIFFSCGIVWGHHVPGRLYLFGAAGLATLSIVFRAGRFSRFTGWILPLSILLSGAGMIYLKEHTLPAGHIMAAPPTDEVAMIGRVAGVPERLSDGRGTRFVLDLSGLETAAGELDPVTGRILLTITDPEPRFDPFSRLIPGMTVRVETSLHAPNQFWNAGSIDLRDYYARRNIHLTGSIPFTEFITVYESPTLIPSGSLSINRFRHRLLNHLYRHSGLFFTGFWSGLGIPADDPAVLSRALLLGSRAELNEEIKRSFQESGLFHLLAISGLHVGIISTLLYWLFRLLPLGYRARSAGTAAMLIFYAFLAGAGPPVMRATLIIGLFLAGRTLDRRADLPNILGLAALILLVFNPSYLFDTGFQLTFTATFGIVFLVPVLAAWIPFIRKIPFHRIILVSLAAQLATAPVSAWYFNRVGGWAFLPYLFLVPIVTASLFSGLLGLMTFQWPSVSICLLKLHGFFLAVLIAASNLIARWPGITFRPVTPPAAVLVLWFLTLAAVLFMRRFRPAVWIAACLAAATVTFQSFHHPERLTGKLRMCFLDVGNADSTLISLPTGTHFLIDGGGTWESSYDVGRHVVCRTLRCLGIRKLAAVAVTHPHPDHQKGVISVLEEFPVQYLWVPSLNFDDPDFKRVLETAQSRGTIVRALDDRAVFDRLEVNTNNRSLVLGIEYNRFRALLPGDAEKEAEAGLIRYGTTLKSVLLKAGHHGSRTSSTPAFLKAVSPDLIVIPCGVKNLFGHPHPEVIRRMNGLPNRPSVYRVDRNGMVEVVTDGTGMTVRSIRRDLTR